MAYRAQCLFYFMWLTTTTSTPILHIIAPIYKDYASIGFMINTFLLQSVSNWTLTFVSDGPDERVESLVKLFASISVDDTVRNSPDPRIRYLFTPQRMNDGGHSPRALGLSSLSQTGWAVLTGSDNYYCPIFVNSVLEATARSSLGLVYWDFVLDRKGSVKASHEPSQNNKYLITMPIIIGDHSIDLSFDGNDNFQEVASQFAQKHGLMEGEGCELGGSFGTNCVAAKLAASMEEELRRATVGQTPAWKDVLDRYQGYVSANLEQGSIDIGAFAFPTWLGQGVGFQWRHHSADWSFASALLEQAEKLNLGVHHIKRTLYVHN